MRKGLSWHHSQMVSNLLQMTALQCRAADADRIYMLVQSDYKEEAACVSELDLPLEKHNCKILHISNVLYSIWPSILGVDRSAMMRELKSLEDQKILHREGRIIHLLTE